MKYLSVLMILALTLCFGKAALAQTSHLNNNSFILVDPGTGFSLTLLPGSLTADQSVSLTNISGTVVSKTAAYTALSSDRFIFASASAAYSITLPTAANKGQLITVTKTDANSNIISVVAAASQSIIQIGTRTTLPAQGYSVTLVADGATTWYVVAHEAADPAIIVSSTQKKQGN